MINVVWKGNVFITSVNLKETMREAVRGNESVVELPATH